jgi:putative oxidoreductase
MLTRDYFQTQTLPSLGLLALRVTAGSAMALHGWPKFQNAFTWMDGFMPGVPGIMQALAAFSEFGGGIALALGLLTPLAALGIIGTMIGALAMVHLPAGDPFVGAGGDKPSYELAMLYLTLSILFLLNSPGKFSLDYALFRNVLKR